MEHLIVTLVGVAGVGVVVVGVIWWSMVRAELTPVDYADPCPTCGRCNHGRYPWPMGKRSEIVCAYCGTSQFMSEPVSETDEQCPVCGLYCTGRGGVGCIDKPGLLKNHKQEDSL